jgi:hypothetical protein
LKRDTLCTLAAGWLIILIIGLMASSAWARLPYDYDEDCDVDGRDLYLFLVDDSGTLAQDLEDLASEFGRVEACLAPVGIGTPVDGYPNWQERALIVFTNMVRMAPAEYRDTYMIAQGVQASGILDPAVYPAVHPLYRDHGLSQSARYHAEDMAYNCGLQHNSCDGTLWSVRIKRYYTDSGVLSENIAYGFDDPLRTLNLFLCEVYGQACVADNSGSDGHRANIMRALSNEIGTGYARGSLPYWVQDFGGGIPEAPPPVAAAAHGFIDAGETSFFVNYYDPAGGPPLGVNVVIDDTHYPLDLDTGLAHAGTYRVDVARAAGCRSYYFLVTAADGTCYRYPGSAVFYTYGEGDCVLDY